MRNRDNKDPQCVVLENHPADSRVKVCEDNVFQTLSSRMGTGGGNVPMVMEKNAVCYRGDAITSPINASNPQMGDPCHTLTDDSRNYVIGDEMDSIVRRLTTLECERLQGYPDGWTDIGEWTDTKGKQHKDADSPRYKALGNSIALPFWEWMAKRMADNLDTENPTMGSLFDGIGGFPLVYSRAGVKPVWASEIEEFPIAVTKIRFPENDLHKNLGDEISENEKHNKTLIFKRKGE